MSRYTLSKLTVAGIIQAERSDRYSKKLTRHAHTPTVVRDLYAGGMSINEIAERQGCTHEAIRQCVRRITYKTYA